MKVQFGKTPEAAAAQRTVETEVAGGSTPITAASPESKHPATGSPVIEVGSTAANPALPVYVPPPVGVPAAPQTSGSGVFDDSADHIDFDQLTLPGLKIVQGVGDLSQIFSPGQLVLSTPGDVMVDLCEAPAKRPNDPPQVPIRVLVVAIRRDDRYSEKIVGGARGRLFSTEQEVLANGGTTNYDEAKATGKPLFQPLATALILVAKPENRVDESGLFSIEVGDSKYALALWHLKGVLYTNGAKPLRTARKFGFLKGGYPTREVLVTTALKSYGQNSAYIPVIKPGAVSGPEVLATVKEILGR